MKEFYAFMAKDFRKAVSSGAGIVGFGVPRHWFRCWLWRQPLPRNIMKSGN